MLTQECFRKVVAIGVASLVCATQIIPRESRAAWWLFAVGGDGGTCTADNTCTTPNGTSECTPITMDACKSTMPPDCHVNAGDPVGLCSGAIQNPPPNVGTLNPCPSPGCNPGAECTCNVN
jgi:hypothetical protein